MATVVLKIVSGEVIPEIEMLESATIIDLKEKIETTLNVGVERQKLKFNNQVLMNEQRIGDCNLKQNASIVLHVKPLGSGQPKFEVSVENEFGNKECLNVREGTYVAQVKSKLYKKQFYGDTLKHLSVEMDDDFPLFAYYVSEYSKIEAITGD